MTSPFVDHSPAFVATLRVLRWVYALSAPAFLWQAWREAALVGKLRDYGLAEVAAGAGWASNFTLMAAVCAFGFLVSTWMLHRRGA